MGEPCTTLHRWTRVLLLQQLLVDAIDLLDPVRPLALLLPPATTCSRHLNPN